MSVARSRICFLYNHDAPHQVAHTAPVISKLAELYPELSLTIFYSGEVIKRNIFKHLAGAAENTVDVRPLTYPKIFRAILFLNKLFPFERLLNLFWNRSVLREFDVFISPETTILLLKTYMGFARQKFIFIPHGAGDRSIGFQDIAQQFDLVLVSGEKTKRRFIKDAGVPADKIKIVGYPKFDSFLTGEDPQHRIFENDNPVFLYNPHFDPGLSSWYTKGLELLEFFKQRPDLNLIFAPHIMLFKRKLHASVEHGKKVLRQDVPKRYYGLSNIIIDVESDKLVDMTYTRLADCYIGDASSQVYEYIHKPRPCIFLKNDPIDAWENNPNFLHWSFGPVISDVSEFSYALKLNDLKFETHYKPLQRQAFLETFADMIQGPSCVAAVEIANFCRVNI